MSSTNNLINIVQTPPPEKRGRKRKFPVPNFGKNIEKSGLRVEKRKRGRPRKKVNSYELVILENLEDFQDFQQDITNFDLGNDELRRNTNCNITNGINSTNGVTYAILQSPSNNGKSPYRKFKKRKIREEETDGNSNITCAVCNAIMDKNLWSYHKQRYHNNLAWRIGDPPLDLSDRSFVKHTLNALYKKKRPMYCDKCGDVKKSVAGFLSHQATCKTTEEQLKSSKITCEHCSRKTLPVSFSTHRKLLHQNPMQQLEEIDNSSSENKLLPTKRSAKTINNEDNKKEKTTEKTRICHFQKQSELLRDDLTVISVSNGDHKRKEVIDDDKAYLLSLIPMLRQFDEEQKFNVRMLMMDVVRQVQLGYNPRLPTYSET